MTSISVDEVLQIHDLVIKTTGGLKGVKDHGRIESAVAGLVQNVFGIEIYPTVLHKAASLMRSLICDHPFADGNKRTAMLCAITYLEINNVIFATEEHEIEDFAVKIATDKLSVEQIQEWLLDNSLAVI